MNREPMKTSESQEKQRLATEKEGGEVAFGKWSPRVLVPLLLNQSQLFLLTFSCSLRTMKWIGMSCGFVSSESCLKHS